MGEISPSHWTSLHTICGPKIFAPSFSTTPPIHTFSYFSQHIMPSRTRYPRLVRSMILRLVSGVTKGSLSHPSHPTGDLLHPHFPGPRSPGRDMPRLRKAVRKCYPPLLFLRPVPNPSDWGCMKGTATKSPSLLSRLLKTPVETCVTQ